MKGLFLITLVAGLVSQASLAQAQDRIAPADEVRVVELADNGYGRTERLVVEDLTPAEVLRIQVELKRAGHDPRSRSGQLDEATRRALTSFQSERGLEICGCVTYETIIALGIAPAVVTRVEKARVENRGGWSSSTVFVDNGPPIVIFVPSHVRRHGHRGFVGSGVVVGHEPAVGAGELFRRRFPIRSDRFDHHRFGGRPDRGRDVRPLPTSPHPGSRIQPGNRARPAPTGGAIRPARPRP